MGNYDVYLYGMILKTHSFLLKDNFPEADTYGEFTEHYVLPGGETGTCATVLASLGCSIKMDGNYMGTDVYPLIQSFYKDKKVDLSALFFEEGYEGLQDYCFIDHTTRTPFGQFVGYFSDVIKRWNMPKEEDIKRAQIVGLDPFFQEASERVAILCHSLGKSYVTIDCPYDSTLHRYASINVLSNEFIHNTYPQADRLSLFEHYLEKSPALTIFTQGAKEILYGRKGETPKTFQPYQVPVISTLGAGDTFKAGCIYGLLKGMKDEELVSFASATAAIACTTFPLPLHPPTLKAIEDLQKTRLSIY
ncbi:carbohydrate kinase [Sporanaerobium hydrogeniformans]|uniref:Carbohydrate kinase n=1 Tax=Sporanaerobium hydrogeniformans TaxID=3072179 RepID=A0AC61DIN0_9FIRM|nr:PfkB family carbohydrate kinase [Sporanaerobium hydrogeniformans]PHV71972.1 carbohydrate kinase [Sporanaerobium hydrogeniformans]